jgi:hypothetical protein
MKSEKSLAYYNTVREVDMTYVLEVASVDKLHLEQNVEEKLDFRVFSHFFCSQKCAVKFFL